MAYPLGEIALPYCQFPTLNPVNLIALDSVSAPRINLTGVQRDGSTGKRGKIAHAKGKKEQQWRKSRTREPFARCSL